MVDVTNVLGDVGSVPLREYVERIFEERQAALTIAFRSQQDALTLATRNLEGRLEKLNELRQEVTRDRGEYITRAQYQSDQREARTWRDRADGGLTIIGLLGGGGAIALLIELARIAGVVK